MEKHNHQPTQKIFKMKKNLKPILLIAGVGAVAYFIFKGSKSTASQRMLTEGESETPEPITETGKEVATTPSGEEIDATINTKDTGGSVQSAIQQAKDITTGIKDVVLLIKTKAGQPNILFRKGKKRRRKPIVSPFVKRSKLRRRRRSNLNTLMM